METSNALAAAIGLAFLTAICAVCMCWPLHPLLARVLPCLGAGELQPPLTRGAEASMLCLAAVGDYVDMHWDLNQMPDCCTH